MDIQEVRRLNLMRLLNENFDGRKGALARAVGKADSYVSRLLLDPDNRHASRMGSAVARDIEVALSLDRYYLDKIINEVKDPAPTYVLNKMGAIRDSVSISESYIRFAAGPGRAVAFEASDEGEPATYRLSWFTSMRIDPSKCKRFRVHGDSMEQILFDGDVILVNLAETHIVDGKIYALRYGDDLRVKRLRKLLDGTLILESANPAYPAERVGPDHVGELISIIGRVRDKSGHGGL